MRRLALGGRVLHHEPFPVGTLLVSATLHVSVLVGLFMAASMWQHTPSKTYIVNLVPAIAAVGTPQGRSEPTPPPKLPEPAPVPPTPAKPAPAPPPDLPVRPAPSEVKIATREPATLPPARHQLPALPDPPRQEPTRRETAALPESSRRPETPPAPAPPTLPKPGEKELPTLSGPIATPPPAISRSIPTAPPGLPSTPAAAVVPPPMPLGRPTGSPQGAGAITLDVSNFPFAWYLQQVQRKVGENWVPPVRGASTRAVIVFEISRDGQVRRPPAVETSSGNAVYDQAAMRAVANANPFPPLPSEFQEPLLRIHLGFDFSERG
jgi:TonB family protein